MPGERPAQLIVHYEGEREAEPQARRHGHIHWMMPSPEVRLRSYGHILTEPSAPHHQEGKRLWLAVVADLSSTRRKVGRGT